MEGEHRASSKEGDSVRDQDPVVGEVGRVSVGSITFAGEDGQRLVKDMQLVAAGVELAEKLDSRISRAPNGTLMVRVTKETIDLVAGRVRLEESDS